ncbi:MAG: bifunctional riboflavin kinase/FAD synthetase [Candidatus Kapaibacteriales bacterium]
MQIWVDPSDIIYDKKHVLTLGTFDGLHKGHLSMITRVVEEARRLKSKSVAITLHPHPRVVLGKADGLELLSSLSERIELFRKSGIDILHIMRFTKELSQMSAESFLEEKLYSQIGMQKLIVGYDHAFGKGREGDTELLSRLSGTLGFELERYSAQSTEDGTVISSSKIRTALNQGDPARAKSMLGYDYMIIGTVVEGHKRGRTIGYPTANLRPEDPHKLIPKEGVYAVSLEFSDENDISINSRTNRKCYFGVCNIGKRPTFTDGKESTIEVHIPFAKFDIYGKTVKLTIHEGIRDEKKFSGQDEIVKQIREDILKSKNMLESLENRTNYTNFADYTEKQP